MSRFPCDTSCLAAAVCGSHEHHTRTVPELEGRARDGDELVIASHSLGEAYAVLTRLPSPHRLTPATARTLLEVNWRSADVIHLTAEETWRALAKASSLGVAGGQCYDALIASWAEKGATLNLRTWYVRHYSRFSNGLRTVGL